MSYDGKPTFTDQSVVGEASGKILSLQSRRNITTHHKIERTVSYPTVAVQGYVTLSIPL